MAEVAKPFVNLPRNFANEGVPQSLQNVAKIEIKNILKRHEEYSGRRFVKGLVIDPEGDHGQKSRDRDDAIWVDEGSRTVHVSIADVAAYIGEGSALDQIAQLKGFTQYKGDHATDPMIARELSEGKLSLLKGQPRLTMTVSIKLTEDYDIGNVAITPTWMISPRDFSYKEAAKARDDESDEFHGQLVVADRIARRLRNKRFGRTEEDQTLRRGEVVSEVRMHRMIEEFMLLANKALAEFATEHDLPIVYRNHKLDGSVYGVEGVGYYSPTCDGHDGLGFDSYLHGTSPLRRYPDLYVWRVIKHYLATGEVRRKDEKRASRVARRVTYRERFGLAG